MATFEMRKAGNSEFFFHLLATATDENLLHSETYKAKSSCNNGMESVRKNAVHDSRYDRRESQDGKYYFVLKAANGEIIGTSSLHATHNERERVIGLVKAQAPEASVVDLT